MKGGATKERIQELIKSVNTLQFTKEMRYKLKTKLMLSDHMVDVYINEYKKFLIMGVLSKNVVSPSE